MRLGVLDLVTRYSHLVVLDLMTRFAHLVVLFPLMTRSISMVVLSPQTPITLGSFTVNLA